MVNIPDSVTRITVVWPGIPEETFWADRWDFHVQDGGRTVKVFAHGSGEDARAERDRAFGQRVEEVDGQV